MKEPAFWNVTDLRSRRSAPVTRALLAPLAQLYLQSVRRRLSRTAPSDCGLPVVCVGNITMGGAGKTPVSAAIRDRLARSGRRVATLSRGYGGALRGPYRVVPGQNSAAAVGDEPLMLAETGEAWISRDRVAAAWIMKAAGVDIIVMDDGHQNPTLKKTLNLVVIDAANPFGNGLTFPMGPMREPADEGLARADAVILMGEGPVPAVVQRHGKKILRARLKPHRQVQPGRYVAFAGIGKPQRFFEFLRSYPGVELVDCIPYPDHHLFGRGDLDYLLTLSKERESRLLTTDKDYVRLPMHLRARVDRASVAAEFDDPGALDSLLSILLTGPA